MAFAFASPQTYLGKVKIQCVYLNVANRVNPKSYHQKEKNTSFSYIYIR